MPMDSSYKRFEFRPVFLHAYMFFLYLLPFTFFLAHYQKPVLILLLFCFGITFLSTFWNVKILLLQCCYKSKNGKFILFKGALEEMSKDPSDSSVEHFFSNRQKHFIRNKKISILQPSLDYTLNQLREGIVVHNYDFYPPNEFKIPNPSFFALFKEQCVTPLFCFQVFSSLLMCFDNHVLNSLFCTGMIVFIEASLVFSRVSTMKIFRKLKHKTVEVTRISLGNSRKRINKEKVSSLLLKPGDKVVIDSLIEIPCDLMIVDGSCAVNEAMLSGESVPLFKEEAPSSDEVLSLQSHKNSILFAGTNLEKVYSPLTCLVLRTAFDTEQGVLISKMLSSEDIKYDPEAFKFIILLTAISLINSAFTYKYSSKSGYPLFIDLIILFTNSIPFELPMEMGMSVQSAVKNLMGKKIFCLEPFRITLAGKVDVCCFDKTGTLTDTKLEVKRIEHSTEFTSKILSVCHNLIIVKDEVKGDPLELAIYNYPFEKVSFKILKLFSFSSELKRQAVVAEIDNHLYFCMKGAPETVEKYLKHVPAEYSEYKEFARQGFRVIALAYKAVNINDLKLSEDRLSDREYFEKNLVFGGFVLLGSSLKDYAVEMCRVLKDAGIKILMITGDNILTAMNVAEQLNLKGKGAKGKEIDDVLESGDFLSYSIFGRAEPKHKELIIKKYQALGYHTMMVGDGTNDVGALKAADVGVAMLESQEILVNKNKKPITLLEKIQAQKVELESIKPGDASIAAPFTVKSNSLRSVIEIIQQGRSSLVTTIQMYKILALNSITDAFFTMMVDILGIKFSDYQMVSLGILSSIGFSAITQPKTLSKIARERPSSSIFNPYIISSILLQSLVQISSLYLVYRVVPFVPKAATVFEPSAMNTILFALSGSQTLSTFICNYIGRPFREDIIENKVLTLSLVGMAAFIFNVFYKYHQDFNNLIQVVDASEYRSFVIGLSVSMIVLCYVSERICFRIFMIK